MCLQNNIFDLDIYGDNCNILKIEFILVVQFVLLSPSCDSQNLIIKYWTMFSDCARLFCFVFFYPSLFCWSLAIINTIHVLHWLVLAKNMFFRYFRIKNRVSFYIFDRKINLQEGEHEKTLNIFQKEIKSYYCEHLITILFYIIYESLLFYFIRL